MLNPIQHPSLAPPVFELYYPIEYRQLAFLKRLHELVLSNCQFIIITHSPIILSYPNATIYDFKDNGADEVDYEDTDVYSITKYFFNHYKKTLEDVGIKV